MPLMMLGAGETATISGMCCTGNEQVRLTEMGLKVGSVIRVVNRNSGGILLAVKESRLAVQSTIAQRIQVEI